MTHRGRDLVEIDRFSTNAITEASALWTNRTNHSLHKEQRRHRGQCCQCRKYIHGIIKRKRRRATLLLEVHYGICQHQMN